ncbi:MAG: phage head closure protein, partial [Oscillospiraceae bacterium]|nr:phage head closure protein [Oscillospiraceae bacterium]
MDVAALRSKVTFQKNETVTDKYGNHKNAWTDYYTCFATIGGEGMASSKEEQVAGTTVEDFSMTVSVRYCQKTAAITSTGYRVMFMDEIY